MSKPKSKRLINTLRKKPKPRKDPRIERIYEEEVEFYCPVKGKIKQKVKIKRYKTFSALEAKEAVPTKDSMSTLEEKDDGMSIYSEVDEPEASSPTEE